MITVFDYNHLAHSAPEWIWTARDSIKVRFCKHSNDAKDVFNQRSIFSYFERTYLITRNGTGKQNETKHT